MSVCRPPIVTAVTGTGSSSQAVPARTRDYLAIINQTGAAGAFSFDGTAAAIGGAGSINMASGEKFIFVGQEGTLVPSSAVNVIGSGSWTILE